MALTERYHTFGRGARSRRPLRCEDETHEVPVVAKREPSKPRGHDVRQQMYFPPKGAFVWGFLGNVVRQR